MRPHTSLVRFGDIRGRVLHRRATRADRAGMRRRSRLSLHQLSERRVLRLRLLRHVHGVLVRAHRRAQWSMRAGAFRPRPPRAMRRDGGVQRRGRLPRAHWRRVRHRRRMSHGPLPRRRVLLGVVRRSLLRLFAIAYRRSRWHLPYRLGWYRSSRRVRGGSRVQRRGGLLRQASQRGLRRRLRVPQWLVQRWRVLLGALRGHVHELHGAYDGTAGQRVRAGARPHRPARPMLGRDRLRWYRCMSRRAYGNVVHGCGHVR